MPESAQTVPGDDAKLLRLLLDGIQDYAIYLLGVDGCVTSWNRGAQQIHGYSGAEVAGQHFSAFYPRDSRAAGQPAEDLRCARDDGRCEREGVRVRKDGSSFWAD